MRQQLFTLLAGLLMLGPSASARAQAPLDSTALRHSVEELRGTVGRWEVVTEFLGDDGKVVRSARGTYEFEWVIPDHVVRGRSEIPELAQVSAILFYVSEAKRLIEMVSVGGDGVLWVMTGPLGGEVRTTPSVPSAAGGSTRLRFTRYNITDGRFESRMEYSGDDGKSWKPANHQVFSRVKPESS